MARTINTPKTPEQIAAEQAAQVAKNDELAEQALREGITAEQREIAAEDEQYRKALHERADLTLLPEGKAKKNHTVKQVSDKVYPGGMVICERL